MATTDGAGFGVVMRRLADGPTALAAVREIVRVQIILIAIGGALAAGVACGVCGVQSVVVPGLMLVTSIMLLVGMGIGIAGIHLWQRQDDFARQTWLSPETARAGAFSLMVVAFQFVVMFGVVLVMLCQWAIGF